MGIEHEDPLERRREELRRIVYGTPGGAEADAAVELAEVEAELEARARGGARAASAPLDSDAEQGASTDAAATSTAVADPSRARRRLSRGRVLALVVAALVLVAGAIALVGPVRDSLSPARGLGVFEREPLPAEMERVDQVSTGARLQPEEAATLRPLGRAFGYDFWVFRDDHRVCLLSQREYFFEWVQSCATLQEFQSHGLTRLLAADDIRDGARPRRVGPGDVVVITWGPESTELEWRIEP